MGLFFSTAGGAQTGFHSESDVLVSSETSEPQVFLNEPARKLSLLDEKYLIPRLETNPPSPSNRSLSTPKMRVQMPPEEKYFDPVIIPE